MRQNRALQNIRLWLTRLGVLSAHPTVFAAAGLFALLWVTLGWQSFGWSAVATTATLVMTLLIQRAEHRDTQAIHAKLDELLRANDAARTELTRLDEQEPEMIERHRERARAADQA
jgi:low affinity Fe/Cu permease